MAGLLLLPLAIGWDHPAGAADDESLADRIASLVRAAGIKDDGPGVGVCVCGPERVLFRRGYGLADLDKKTQILPETTFELASVSKQLTGIAILALVERGKVSFDDDVRKYLPELPQYDKDRPVTLGDLSRHTSGLPDYMSFEGVKGRNEDYLSNADFVPEFARQHEEFPLLFPPGAKSVYSNTGYMLLASVVERVSGKSLGAFLKEEVFDPLGMKTAWVNESPKAHPHDPAVGYTRKRMRWTPSRTAPTADHHELLLTTGDGAVWCSLNDMAVWDAGLREGKPVKAETLRAALAPRKCPRRSPDRLRHRVERGVRRGGEGDVHVAQRRVVRPRDLHRARRGDRSDRGRAEQPRGI